VFNNTFDNYIPALNEILIRGIIRFNTYSFTNFNWIHEAFYVNGVKVIPSLIEEILTAQGLAIWIMDDGSYLKDRGIVYQHFHLRTKKCYFYLNC